MLAYPEREMASSYVCKNNIVYYVVGCKSEPDSLNHAT
jgi:hypothetical protein